MQRREAGPICVGDLPFAQFTRLKDDDTIRHYSEDVLYLCLPRGIRDQCCASSPRRRYDLTVGLSSNINSKQTKFWPVESLLVLKDLLDREA